MKGVQIATLVVVSLLLVAIVVMPLRKNNPVNEINDKLDSLDEKVDGISMEVIVPEQ